MRALLIALAALSLTACATSQRPSGPPTLDVAAGQPAPVQVRLYAACIAQSNATQQYDREDGLIRFHCGGDIARTFYDALGDYSVRIRSERTGNGRIWRFTQVMQHNPSGLDYCWRDDAGGYACTVVLNAGDFIRPETEQHH
ncbi:MAG: hypothetical protein HY054_09555 [Proteobacteria bacterium]|nr:hypothetical protein [Pseudomonadota bacterium]